MTTVGVEDGQAPAARRSREQAADGAAGPSRLPGGPRPLHVTVLQLVMTLVVATAATIGVSTYLNTRAAVQELTDRLMAEVSEQTTAKTQAFLDQAQPALLLMRDALLDDPRCKLNHDNPPEDDYWRARALHLARTQRAYPRIARLFYGDRWANHCSVNDYGGGNVVVDHRWRAGNRARAWFYPLGTSGRLGSPHAWSNLVPDWDVRQRPWYQLAVTQGSPAQITWTEPFRQGDTGAPGVSAGLPVTQGRRLLGVAGANIELAELDRFVQRLQSARGQRVYLLAGDSIIAQPGELDGERAAASPLARLVLPAAGSSRDPVLRTAARSLRLPAYTGTAAPVRLSFSAGGERYLGVARRFPIGRGPLWTALVVIPEQRLLSAVYRNTRLTVASCCLALLLALGAGAWLSRKIAQPLRAFAVEMQRVGDFVISGEPAPSSSVLEVSLMGTALDRMKTSLRSFAKYVPIDLVRRLHQGGQEATLGGQTARLTILFSDVVGFTSIAERVPPATLVEGLAVYLEAMEAGITAHGGIVDKYVGDAVMAFWGAPIHPEPNPETHACAAALEYLREEENRRAGADPACRPFLEARIGIHTGEALVGNFGSERRMDYTAIGDTVNLASRIEALNRRYGTRILVSETTFEAVRTAFEARLIDRVATYGRAAHIGIYELLAAAGDLDDRRRAVRAAYEEGLARYTQRDWSGARERFREALSLSGAQDGPSRVLLSRCEAYEQSPPPESWDGVFVLTEK